MSYQLFSHFFGFYDADFYIFRRFFEGQFSHFFETVKSLLELGADISLTDDKGLTAFDYAVDVQADDIIELLKSY